MMNGAAVSWQSVQQTVTALSLAEAKYYAASSIGCDIISLRRLLEMMGYTQKEPTPVAEDNVACIYIFKSSAMFHKSKHINVRVYRLREFVRDNGMMLYHISTAHDQVANALTKSLPSIAFIEHSTVMLGKPPAP